MTDTQFAAARERLIVALDTPDLDRVHHLVAQLKDVVGAFKVGKELFVAQGPKAVRTVHDAGGRVFLDLKFHDIPNTVAGAVRSACGMGVWMMNVHASGGLAMMRAAADAAAETAKGTRPLVIGVTILTSLDDEALDRIGYRHDAAAMVPHLARLAQEGNLDGVVASPREVAAIREACGKDFLIVTPGVRPAGSDINDQKRIATPGQAIRNGASHLVVGRPITGAENPAEAATAIVEEIIEARA